MVTRQNATERVVAPSLPRAPRVGAGVVGARVVGEVVGDGVGQFSTSSTGVTPHNVDAHRVPSNGDHPRTPSSTHQPRSWLKREA